MLHKKWSEMQIINKQTRKALKCDCIFISCRYKEFLAGAIRNLTITKEKTTCIENITPKNINTYVSSQYDLSYHDCETGLDPVSLKTKFTSC